MRADLLPCPFCGKNNIEAMGAQVICEQCGAGTMVHDNLPEAVNAWNRRAALSVAAEPEPVASISLQDPMIIIAGIKQFGLAPDGSDIRDLVAAIEALRASPPPVEPGAEGVEQ